MRFPIFIKTNPIICDIAYFILRKCNWIEKYYQYFTSVPKLSKYHKNILPKWYSIKRISIALTNICNAKCVFCAYPKTIMPKGFLQEQDLNTSILLIKKLNINMVDLTPTVGDVLLDKNLELRIDKFYQNNIKIHFTTNLIAAKDFLYDESFLKKISRINISLSSLDKDDYFKIYGVDKFDIVFENLCKLLEVCRKLKLKNKQIPKIFIWFRNSQKPSKIIRNSKFKFIKQYFGENVSLSFTAWMDNWGGVVTKNDIKGWMRLKPYFKLNKPCVGLSNLSILQDGKIRLCGCRFKDFENDDLVVGNVNDNQEIILNNIKPIILNFYKGKRPLVCQKCTFYMAEKKS